MATTVDEILVRIELDMAKLRGDLQKVSRQTEAATDKMSNSFRKVGRAIAAVGGTAIFGSFIKSTIQTGAQIEALEVQLTALLGSAEEGAAAFEHMQKFAARVPFSLRDIQRGAGSLAAASSNADDLNALLQATGNIAAQFGMGFDEAAMNLQRALSAGIGAADQFRDRGVSAFAGFEAGVSYSAAETARIILDTFGAGGTADGAMDQFAKTTGGALSMLGDAVFNFQGQIAQSGLNEGFIELTNVITDILRNSKGLATEIGQTLGFAFRLLAKAIEFAADNLRSFAIAFGVYLALGVAINVVNGVRQFVKLATAIKASGIAMRFFNAITKRTPLLLIAAALGYTADQLGLIEEAAEFAAEAFDGLLPEHVVKNLKDFGSGTLAEVDEGLHAVATAADGVPSAFNIITDMKAFEEAKKLVDKYTFGIKNLNDELKELQKIGKDSELFDAAQEAIEKITHQIRYETEPVFASFVDAAMNLGDGITSIFEKMVAGTKVTMDDFKQLIRQTVAQVIAQIFRLTVVNAVLNSIFPGLGLRTVSFSSLFNPVASGGAISPRQPYLVGERGPELIVPQSAATVMNSNNTRSALSGGDGVTVVQNINVTTGVQQTVRTEIRSLMPEIAASAKMAVADTKRRGGGFGRAFS
jgi:tetratricopeptide (TPR) repeat protein|tara:strand:- start:1168 stop:3096 length:1929 start_codon:yes stop_codon:yes gene_type:complete